MTKHILILSIFSFAFCTLQDDAAELRTNEYLYDCTVQGDTIPVLTPENQYVLTFFARKDTNCIQQKNIAVAAFPPGLEYYQQFAFDLSLDRWTDQICFDNVIWCIPDTTGYVFQNAFDF